MNTLSFGEKRALAGGSYRLQLHGLGSQIDAVLIGLDPQLSMSDERYFVYFNHLRSPEGALERTSETAFSIDLARVPSQIDRLQLSLAWLADGCAKDLGEVRIDLVGADALQIGLAGNQFGNERCLIALELYRRDGGWRIGALGQGFAGGLDALLRSLGAKVDDAIATAPSPALAVASTTPSPVRTSGPVDLAKRVAQQAPALVSLAKSAAVSLAKQSLSDVKARVALVLDCSGSMSDSYQSGKVQAVIDRLLPLAIAFDDDGQIDTWLYSDRCKAIAPLNASNYQSLCPRGFPQGISVGGNNEVAVIEAICASEAKAGKPATRGWFGSSSVKAPATQLPMYLLFVTDGGISAGAELDRALRAASKLPIFWQFVGLGGSGYGPLEHLDRLTGRVVDNASFFAIDDMRSINDQTLYDRLLLEFPSWLTAARAASIFR